MKLIADSELQTFTDKEALNFFSRSPAFSKTLKAPSALYPLHFMDIPYIQVYRSQVTRIFFKSPIGISDTHVKY